MKKIYMTPQVDVVELKMTNQVLIGSPDSIPYSRDSEDIIDDPGDIH
jgi:hypothetical protein